jgi:hypothetical protein
MDCFWLHSNEISTILEDVKYKLHIANPDDPYIEEIFKLICKCIEHLDEENEIIARAVDELEKEEARRDSERNCICYD